MTALMKSLVCTAALMPALAGAADGYWGGSFGRVEGDDSRNGWKVYAGVPLSGHFGMEVGYLELGEIEAVISAPADSFPHTGSGFTLAATGHWPLADSGVTVLGRAGMFRWEETYSLGVLGTVNEEGNDGFYGIGLEWPVMGVSTRLDVERYRVNSGDITMYSLGLTLPFGF